MELFDEAIVKMRGSAIKVQVDVGAEKQMEEASLGFCVAEEATQYIIYTHQIGISALLMSSVCALMGIFSCSNIQYLAMANIQLWQVTDIQQWRIFPDRSVSPGTGPFANGRAVSLSVEGLM